MGALAPLFTAAFQGPNGNGLNADGSPYAPSPVDAAALGAAIDNAIPNAQDLNARFGNTSSTVAQIEAFAHEISDQAGEIGATASAAQATANAAKAQFGDTSSTLAQVEAFAHEISDQAGRVEATADSAAAIAKDAAAGVAGAVMASAAAQAAADSAAASAQISKRLIEAVADLQATVPLNSRPGDNPDAFTTDLYAGSTGLPPTALPVTGIGGQSLRVTGAITLGNIGLRSIEPNRLYKVRSAFRRVVDTADPAGAAVTFAVAWYGADRNLMALPSTEVATVRLAVASGRVQYEALFSSNPPDQTDLGNPRVAQPPAGAAYFRPFLRTFTDDVVTDLEVIEHADVTDVAFPASLPLDAVLARLARVEAALNLPAM